MVKVNSGSVVIERKFLRLSPWLTLVTKTMGNGWHTNDPKYHSLQQADYVSVLGVTDRNMVPLVTQYRPAVEKYTLELPGGLVEDGEVPSECVKREVLEETGFCVVGEPELLGCLAPDTGRLENNLWCFFARLSRDPVDKQVATEVGLDSELWSMDSFFEAIKDGSLDHALHVSVVGLALLRGCIKLPRA